ncbi:MAG: hypothetical protein ACRD6N_01260, partial [Pyrinomonadaceae bacterium]
MCLLSRTLNGSATLEELNEYASDRYYQQEMYDRAEFPRSNGHLKQQCQQDRNHSPKHVSTPLSHGSTAPKPISKRRQANTTWGRAILEPVSKINALEIAGYDFSDTRQQIASERTRWTSDEGTPEFK